MCKICGTNFCSCLAGYEHRLIWNVLIHDIRKQLQMEFIGEAVNKAGQLRTEVVFFFVFAHFEQNFVIY